MSDAPHRNPPPKAHASPAPGHEPVLVEPLLALLQPAPGETALDCTVGRGGHALAIAEHLGAGGHLIGLDVDPDNLASAENRLAEALPQVTLVRANFARAPAILAERNVAGVEMLVADLGFASSQVAAPERGFSWEREGPLDMRLDPSLPRTAADVVNELPQPALARLIRGLGEEKAAAKIAGKIVARRQKSPIKTTVELAKTITAAVGDPRRGGPGRIHPATRTFMALRMAVNGELEALDRLLESLPGLLTPGGRAAMISFHSLEDRRVKQAMARFRREGIVELLTPRPVVAGEAERSRNPRSRSAKLRVMKRIGYF